jgi:protein-L-isoaspartate(D-aspartate) O-methyltransferase
MFDFKAARLKMVYGQVQTADVTDAGVIDSMREVPREQFLPPESRSLAYLDLDVRLPEAPQRRLLTPMLLAKLLQAAAVREGERVLDIACATGYAAALLTRCGAAVVALEANADFAARTKANLAALGIATVVCETGPLEAGGPGNDSFDVILVEGAFAQRPDRLCARLAENGRLVGILDDGGAPCAVLYRRTGADVSMRRLFSASAAPLPGFVAAPHFTF